jgi:hypothetical protein
MQGEKKNEEQRLDLDIRSKQQEKLANDSTMSHINKLKVHQYQVIGTCFIAVAWRPRFWL